MIKKARLVVRCIVILLVVMFSVSTITACCPKEDNGCDWFTSNEEKPQKDDDK